MTSALDPLIDDEYTGQSPSKRLLGYLLERRKGGAKFVGLYCAYAPNELIYSLDLVPVSLCAYSNAKAEAAESVLPSNLCPLIKSSFGFIVTDTCPFFALSDAVVGETTCDGKKKMFELISDRKPMHVMDLPQMPDEPEAAEKWAAMIRKFQAFLESTFEVKADDADIERAIHESNRKSRLMNEIFSYAALDPPAIGWRELYELLALGQSASGDAIAPTLESAIGKLEKRKSDGLAYGKKGAPRVMVTGCPIGGDSEKIFNILEEAGGTIVALEACSGFKPYMTLIEEGTRDPVQALAERYLKIPCSCMTPNGRRLDDMDRLIEGFKPDAVVDVVLQACHSYNIESIKVGAHIKDRHGLPFLKIVTDYSQNDAGQIRTRVEALLEMCRG